MSYQSTSKSNYLFSILIASAALVAFPGFSQEASKLELSLTKNYTTVDGNVKLYYDLSDHIVMIKINPEKTSIQRFDKTTQTTSEKLSLPKKDLIWINSFQKDHLVYCFYWKWGKNKLIRAAREVFMDIIDIQTGDFVEQQKFLFETQLNASAMGWDTQTNTEKAFNTSVSDNNEYVVFNYNSLNTGPTKQDQLLSNVFSLEELKITKEIILKRVSNEPLIYIESKAGTDGKVLYLARTLNSNRRVLGIISSDGSEIQNIPLSDKLSHIDTIQFFPNTLNGNILVGGIYNEDGDYSKPGAFAMEINYEGEIVKEVNYLLDNSGLENVKTACLQQILNISLENDNTIRFTTFNIKTNEVLHDHIRSNGVNVNSQKDQLYPLSQKFTQISSQLYIPADPSRYMQQQKVKSNIRMIELNRFEDLFYFSIDPETKKKNLYLNRYSKADNSSKNYLIIENDKLLGVEVKQIPLFRIIPIDEEIYYFEVYLGEKKDAMITIHLK